MIPRSPAQTVNHAYSIESLHLFARKCDKLIRLAMGRRARWTEHNLGRTPIQLQDPGYLYRRDFAREYLDRRNHSKKTQSGSRASFAERAGGKYMVRLALRALVRDPVFASG